MAAGSDLGDDDEDEIVDEAEDDDEDEQDEKDEEDEEDEESDDGEEEEELEESAEFIIGSDEGEVLELEDGSEPSDISGDEDDDEEEEEDDEEEDEQEVADEEIEVVVSTSRKNKRKADDSPVTIKQTKRARKVNFPKILEAPRSGGKGFEKNENEVVGILKKAKVGGANGRGVMHPKEKKPLTFASSVNGVKGKKEKVKAVVSKAVDSGLAGSKEEGAYDFTKHFF